MKRSNFYDRITGSNEAIKSKRAIQLEKSAKRELKAQVDLAQGKVDDKDYELERLLDLAPVNAQSLQYRDDFVPKEWAEDVAEVTSQMLALEMKVERLEETYNFLFVDEVKKEKSNE